MPAFLLGIWGYIAAAVIAGAASGWAVHAIDNGAYQSLVAKQATQQASANAAALAQVEGWAKQIHDAATAYTNTQAALNDQIDNIQSELRNVKTKLPSNCKPDGERVRALTGAFEAARAAASGQ